MQRRESAKMKITIKTDFDKLAKAFEKAPAETKKTVRVQVKRAVEDIKEEAQKHHRYQSRSGILERDGLITHVSDNVGVIALNPRVPYGVFVHEGTQPHIILPRNKKVLRWSDGNKFIFSKSVVHPGTKPDQFLYNAADTMQPIIQSRFENAISEIVRSL